MRVPLNPHEPGQNEDEMTIRREWRERIEGAFTAGEITVLNGSVKKLTAEGFVLAEDSIGPKLLEKLKAVCQWAQETRP
jgi:hypothetical protein